MSQEATDFNHAIRNVDEDISKCEEFLCKILNARVNSPLQLTALQNALDNHRLMASTRASNMTTAAKGPKNRNISTPPVKLSRNVANRNFEQEKPTFQRTVRTVDKGTCRSRTTSCGSERSLKRAPLIENDDQEVTLDMKCEAKLNQLHKTSSHVLVSKQSWSQLLSENHKTSTPKVYNANILPGTFSQFDPLRTLHFLTKELQSKLYIIAPEETAVHRILSEIQHSLYRLPIGSKSDVLAGSTYPDLTAHFNTQYIQSSQTCQFTQTSALAVVHQHCQTEETLDSLEQNKELELKCVKLELSNKNLMEACASANGERDRLAETLKYHESNNKLLSDEIDELKKQLAKDEFSPKAEEIIEELKQKNKSLEAEKLATVNEYKAKLAIADETLQQVKENKHNEYTSYMDYKLELGKKNAKFNDDFKSRSDLNGGGGGGTFLSRNYDLKDRHSTRLIKSGNDSSHYSLRKRRSERKYRPGSQRHPDYELRLKDSRFSTKTTDDDTAGGHSKCDFAISEIFEKMRKEVVTCNVTLPSPPRRHHHLKDMSSSQSQWSDSIDIEHKAINLQV